jgi:hypothetical protein
MGPLGGTRAAYALLALAVLVPLGFYVPSIGSEEPDSLLLWIAVAGVIGAALLAVRFPLGTAAFGLVFAVASMVLVTSIGFVGLIAGLLVLVAGLLGMTWKSGSEPVGGHAGAPATDGNRPG